MSLSTRRTRLQVSPLEVRTNPSTFIWDGGGGANDNWTFGLNWVGDTAPTAADVDTVVVFNTVDPNSVMDIVGMDVAKIQFDAGSDVTLVLNEDLILDGAGAAVNIQDTVASTNVIAGPGSLVLTNADVVIDHPNFPGFLQISAPISGLRGFTKTGVGTLILSTTGGVGNTYAGTTTIADGVLELQTDTSDVGVSSTIVVGDGVGAAGTAVFRLGANSFEIPDSTTLTINGDGRVNVPTGTVDDVTALNVDGGRLNIAAGGFFQINPGGLVSSNGAAGSVIDGAGRFTADSGLLRFDVADGPGATDLLISTQLTESSMSATLIKTGTGTLEFAMTAANTLTGATFIRDGVLLLNTNTTDAALSGTITIGDNIGGGGSAILRLVNSSEIADTAGIRVLADGLLDVTATASEIVASLNLNTGSSGGGFAIATGGVFQVLPLGLLDTIDLTGGSLTFNRTGPLVPVGQTVTLIDNLGSTAVTGTFAGLPEGGMLTANGQTFTISYIGGTGNDVVLTPVPPIVPPLLPVFVPEPLNVSGEPNGSAIVFLPAGAGQYAATSSATLTPFAGFTGNVRTATADVNGDDIADTILVTGPGTAIRVTVISGVDNSTVLVTAFDPFGGDFTGGGFLAAGDIDGDGKDEFIVTPDQGGGPRVSIFTRNVDGSITRLADFFGIDDPNFRGGARSALGDVNKDGTPDLVVCAGFLGGPRAALFNGTTLLGTTPTRLINDFFAFPGTDSVTLRNGVFVAVGDIDGDGFADLIFGGGPGGAPRVFILSGALVAANDVSGAQATPIANFFVANNSTDRGGVRLAAKNADGDALADLAVGSGEGSPALARVYLGANFTTTGEPSVFQDLSVFGGQTLAGGVFVG